MLGTLEEIYAHRVLVTSLVARQLRARYRGSILGFVWTFLNPVLLMLVYTLVFSLFVRSNIKPYSLYFFSGLLPWIWFSSSVLDGANSIVSGGSLITKALFPPQILPAVVVVSNMMNFLFCLPLLFGFMLGYGRLPGWPIVALPVVMLVQLVLSFPFALAVAALNVHYRDVQHILGNLLTLWFFLCPILYAPSDVTSSSPKVAMLLDLVIVKANPMSAVAMAYQDIFFWNRWPHWKHLGVVALGSAVVFFAAVQIFHSLRDTFAEEI